MYKTMKKSGCGLKRQREEQLVIVTFLPLNSELLHTKKDTVSGSQHLNNDK